MTTAAYASGHLPYLGGTPMQAITVQDRAAGASGLALTELPHPHAAENDVIVKVHAAGFTPGELDWPGTGPDTTGPRACPATNCPASSPNSATAPPG